jgi:tetratricopeptide (TPR) repeat protein
LLRDTLKALEDKRSGPGISPRFPQTHFSDLLQRSALEEAIQLIRRDEKTGRRDERAWADLLRRYPQLPLTARRMLYEMAPDSVELMAHLLASLRTPEAAAALREFITGQQGTHEDRMTALRFMQQADLLPPGTEIEIWMDGQRQKIQPLLLEISEEFVPDYPPKVWELYEQAVVAQREGHLDKAEQLYEAMLKIEPNTKEAYNNLAMIYQQRGETDRVDEAVEKALAIDPLYPFPRCARALQALQREGAEAARKWLEPLRAVRQWHPLGFVVFQKALARIALMEKDYETARKHLETAKQLNEDDKDIPDLLTRVDLAERVGQIADMFTAGDARYREQRQRVPLPADPTLADCFGILTKGDMTGIRETLNLTGISALKKDPLRQYLIARLTDPAFLARVVAELNDRERAALAHLLDHGGTMAHEAFTRVYGVEDERPYLEFHATRMKSVLGRLRARGLLFVGRAEGRLIVAAPRELRPLLRETLNQYPAAG